jgi:hypothetical protein
MNKLSREQVVELKQKLGLPAVHRFDDDEIGLHVVFKAPNWAAWKDYQGKLATDKENVSTIIKQMVIAHLVYPSTDEFDAFLNTSPASAHIVMGEIGEVAGQRSKGVREKL